MGSNRDIRTKKVHSFKKIELIHFLRHAHGTVIIKKEIFIFGGHDEYDLSSAGKYDLTSKSWHNLPSMPEARYILILILIRIFNVLMLIQRYYFGICSIKHQVYF